MSESFIISCSHEEPGLGIRAEDGVSVAWKPMQPFLHLQTFGLALRLEIIIQIIRAPIGEYVLVLVGQGPRLSGKYREISIVDGGLGTRSMKQRSSSRKKFVNLTI